MFNKQISFQGNRHILLNLEKKKNSTWKQLRQKESGRL